MRNASTLEESAIHIFVERQHGQALRPADEQLISLTTAILIEKGLGSEEVKAQPSQEEDSLCVCKPYSAGAKFTLADLYTYYCFGLAGTPTPQLVGIDLLSEQPQIAELLERLAKRPSIARVTAESAS